MTIGKPRIVGVSLVKNEQDIIEPFVLHNLRFLDALFVIDNGSVDQTLNILNTLQSNSDGLFLSHSSEFGYTQSERITNAVRHIQSAFFADYILPIDADEFISATSKSEFTQHLGLIPSPGVGLMPWRTYVLRQGSEIHESSDVPRTMRHFRAQETPQYYKAIVRTDGVFDPSIVIEQGSHAAHNGRGRLPTVTLNALPLLHFPVRSQRQIINKAVVGWAAYAKKNVAAREAGQGYQWRNLFDLIADGGEAAITGKLSQLSQAYAAHASSTVALKREEPNVFDYERRVSESTAGDPLSVIAKSWEQSLRGRASSFVAKRPNLSKTTAMASKTSFDAAWHWDNLFLDVPPFAHIAEKFSPATVLDIGCGIGQYLRLFKNRSKSRVIGIDGVPSEATDGVIDSSEYIYADLREAVRLNERFDVVLCVEVAEHLDELSAMKLIDSIDAHASNLIVFSAAEVGQPGHGHINCKPISYWLDLWKLRGWSPDLIESLGVRALATFSWLRRNLLVLRKGISEESAEYARSELLRIAAKRYAWYGQAPGVREEPFGEPRFSPGEGYVT